MELKERLEIIKNWISNYDLEKGLIWSSTGKLLNNTRKDGYIQIRGPYINGKQILCQAHQLIYYINPYTIRIIAS
jgi:hypothetical protein